MRLVCVAGCLMTLFLNCTKMHENAGEKVNGNNDAPPTVSAETQRAIDRLAYLNDLPEVAWYEVRRNNVYIGLRHRGQIQGSDSRFRLFDENFTRDDLELLVRSAALHGHRAYGSGFHAWAIAADERDKIGDSSMPFFAESTARYGKVEDYNAH